MATQIQFRRGTKTQHNSFTGATAEVTVNTTNKSLHVHDGTTQGGFEQAKVDLTNVSGATNLSLSGITTTNSLSIGSTQVISSARQLQNIVSLDATTTATIESAVAAAPNDFTSLNISGLSTFSGITTHTTSLFGTHASFSGVITATSFVGAITGAVTGTATSTTNIPNLTGAITSNNTTTSLGSFTSSQLATALTDETGSGSAVFATSPVLVTPSLGIATATSINASGIITATTFVGALTGTATSTTNIPNLTGDITSVNKATTLATVNSNVGTFGDTGAIPVVTVNGKGLVTGVTTVAPNNGTLTLATSGTGLSGSTSFTANQSGASTFTVTSNATNANTASAIVARDASGNFSAGTITASLTGTASSTTNIPNLIGAITSVNTTTSLGSFTSAQLATALTDETGSGSAVFATSPTLVTPVLGTPSSGNLTNCTSLPISGLTASTSTALGVGSIELGHATDTTISRVSAGVVAIEGVNVVTTSSTDTLTNKTLTSPTLTTPVLGTPSSGTLTSCTGLPVSTGISGLAANVATFLATPSSTNLISAVTDETGTGALVFATSPTLVTPTLGAATATSIVVGSGVTINASGINASGIATASQLSTGASGTGINITTNTISGPATITIDPAAVGDNTGLVVIKGDLQIDGTTTTINSTTVTVDDKNIVLGSGAINDAAADGSGITIESGNGNKTFQFEDTGDNLGSSENINVASGKVYKINNTSVLSSTTLGSGVINSSLTSVGTLTNLNVGNVYSSGIVTATTFVGALTGTASNVTTNANLTGDVTSIGNATAIAAGVIVDADINASAGIVDTKLATISTALKVSNSATTATNANTASAIVARDASGNFSAGTITASLTGTASTATNIPNLTGDITSVNTVTSIAAGVIVNADINASAAIAVSKLAASTISGIALGNNLNALTISTGLSGSSYNGSGAVTIAIDSTVATLTGTQTLTNKTLTSPTLTTPVLGTPSSGTLTSCTGLPVSTGISGLAANVATFLATPSSTNLAAALTDETGSGALVFATSPTLVTPALGTPSSGTLTSCTGLPITGITSSTTIGLGVGSIELGHATDTTLARSAAGVVTIEGVEVVTLSRTQTLTNKTLTSPTLTTPALGTPASGTLTSCTGLPIVAGTTGTLSVARGGTGVTASTGTGSVVLSASPTFTGTVGAAAITATGDIAAANFNSTSDISLKDNIQTIVNPIDKITKLNGVTFNWKENQKPSIGVIAQELEKVLPELVTQGDIKSVNYNGLIGVLIEAVKEQQKQIDELKAIVKNQ